MFFQQISKICTRFGDVSAEKVEIDKINDENLDINEVIDEKLANMEDLD